MSSKEFFSSQCNICKGHYLIDLYTFDIVFQSRSCAYCLISGVIKILQLYKVLKQSQFNLNLMMQN